MVGWKADLGIRAGGLLACGIAWAAIDALVRIGVPRPPACPDIAALALAVAGFLCGCAGAAMIAIGGHVFDPVQLSARWRRLN